MKPSATTFATTAATTDGTTDDDAAARPRGGSGGQKGKAARPTPPKQEKPYPDFPLCWHARGYWCKKIEGRVVGFGADWQEALKRFHLTEQARADGELAASVPRARATLGDLVDAFLSRQLDRMEAGEIGEVQFAKYRYELLERLPESTPFGTRLNAFCGAAASENFQAIRAAAVTRGTEVARRHIVLVRAMLDWGGQRRQRLLPHAPDYGDDFDPPTSGQVEHAREAREEAGGVARAWTTDELRAVVGFSARNPQLHAQVLLALNAAFGSADLATLREDGVFRDPATGVWFARHRRAKSPRLQRIRRRLCPLWPETVAAIDASRDARATPADPAHAGLLFLTTKGNPVRRKVISLDEDGLVKRAAREDKVALNFRRLLAALNKRRAKDGLKAVPAPGFYTLRAMSRSLMTGGGADRDLIAVIMGRRFAHPVDEYYLRADLREKLVGVVEHVRRQLFCGPWPAIGD